MRLLAGPGIPLVQFRTVQLGDGQLQLQRRKACMYQSATTTDPGSVQICRLDNDGTQKANPVVVHNSITLSQIQRVLHDIETATLQRALAEKPVPGDPESRAVDGNECFSLVYVNQYVDFEIMPTSTVKGRDLKRWLVWRAILESMTQPMPAPKAKSQGRGMPRGARGAILEKQKTKPDNDHEDKTINEKLVGPGCFAASVEMGTLPQPFLSPSVANVEAAAAAAVAHGQAAARVALKAKRAHPGPLVEMEESQSDDMLIATSQLDPKRAGNVTCHGCEPAPFSKTAAVASKTNQDAGCVVWPLCGDPRMLFLGVFDGHGELGHRASKYCMRRIVESISADGAAALSVPKDCGKSLVKAFEGSNTTIEKVHLDWGNDGSVQPLPGCRDEPRSCGIFRASPLACLFSLLVGEPRPWAWS